MRHPHADHHRQSFAHIFARRHQIFIDACFFTVGIQTAREGGAKTRNVRAALGGRDVVDVTMEIFGELTRVLHGNIPGNALVFPLNRDHVGVNGIARTVEPLDKLHDAALVVELLLLLAGHVCKGDPHARI